MGKKKDEEIRGGRKIGTKVGEESKEKAFFVL